LLPKFLNKAKIMLSPNIVTVLILSTLLMIITSLGFGLFYLLTEDNGQKTAKFLSIRVTLSMLLFLTMILAIHQGWITPNPPPL
jgi:Trk-type K+ transport system membrane component